MSIESTELKIYIDNDYQLYSGQRKSIVDNLLKKKNAGKYDSAKSVKLWEYLVESGAKKYAKEFGGTWHSMFSVADRKQVARELRDDFEDAHRLGEYMSRQEALETKAQRKARTGSTASRPGPKRKSPVRRKGAKGKGGSKRSSFKDEYIRGFPEREFSSGIERKRITSVRKVGMRGSGRSAEPVVIIGFKHKPIVGKPRVVYMGAIGHRPIGPIKDTLASAKAHAEYARWADMPVKKSNPERLGGDTAYRVEYRNPGETRWAEWTTLLYRKQAEANAERVRRDGFEARVVEVDREKEDIRRMEAMGRKKPAKRKTTKKRRTTKPRTCPPNCTKVDVEKMFKSTVIPVIVEGEESRGGRLDKPGRREAWNNFIDGLARDGTITEKQADTWGHPKWLETYRGRRR